MAGVDFLGFIFASKSPRRIAPAKAREIRASLASRPHLATPKFVGVFVEHAIGEILEIARSVPLDVIQLHSRAYSDDDAAAVKAAGLQVWRLDSPTAMNAVADAILIDGIAPTGATGGTGILADWSRIDQLKRSNRRVVLAGGIAANNIASALATDADIIDVNSSLESSPGVKSSPLLEDFIQAFHFADALP